jgi:6-phosphogluconolactonase
LVAGTCLDRLLKQRSALRKPDFPFATSLPMARFLLLFLALMSLQPARAADALLFIGTYTRDGRSHGIYSLRLNLVTGALTAPVLAAEAPNPTFLALHPDKRHLYAGGELRATKDQPQGGVGAYAINAAAGTLDFLNQQPTGDGATTHVAIDATGRMAMVANYGAGYVCALPIDASGRLGERSAYLELTGPLGPNQPGQDKPHAHSVTVSPDNHYVFACTLGLDRVYGFKIDPAKATLVPAASPFTATPAGVGPRHSKFSADGRFFYVVNELGGSVCVFAYDAVRGALTLRQTISSLPAGFRGGNTSAEIRLSPDGRFVYASNRGPDSLAVFARDPAAGTLTVVEIVPSGGKHPRNFALSPDGRWLLCANRDTDNVVVFRVDAVTGRLTPTANSATIAQPVCVLFVE